MDTRKKILYVDDEKINLDLFRINFSRKYEVITGFDGFEGLDLLEKNPDTKVVISDMRMPKMNGLEFIIKAKTKYKEVKFFILTGYDITHEIKEAIENGLILKYFRKPFNMSEIEAAINLAL